MNITILYNERKVFIQKLILFLSGLKIVSSLKHTTVLKVQKLISQVETVKSIPFTKNWSEKYILRYAVIAPHILRNKILIERNLKNSISSTYFTSFHLHFINYIFKWRVLQINKHTINLHNTLATQYT